MYIYIYLYIQTYIHTYTYMHIHIYVRSFQLLSCPVLTPTPLIKSGVPPHESGWAEWFACTHRSLAVFSSVSWDIYSVTVPLGPRPHGAGVRVTCPSWASGWWPPPTACTRPHHLRGPRIGLLGIRMTWADYSGATTDAGEGRKTRAEVTLLWRKFTFRREVPLCKSPSLYQEERMIVNYKTITNREDRDLNPQHKPSRCLACSSSYPPTASQALLPTPLISPCPQLDIAGETGAWAILGS